MYDAGDGERYILVPEDMLEWQRCRNASGMYGFAEDSSLDELTLANDLWERFRRTFA